MHQLWRKILRAVHPEGIPRLGASFYDLLSKSGVFQEHYCLVALDVSKYCKYGSLLDVGTGPGWLLLAIHKFSPALQLVGLDISNAMVQKAKNNLKGCDVSIEIHTAKAAAIPYPDNCFECIVSTGSIHHWKDIPSSLREIYRVLKPGGYALIYDLIQKLPPAIQKEMSLQYSKFKMALLWLHTLEEPFYSVAEIEALPLSTPFTAGKIHFTGALCCLELKK